MLIKSVIPFILLITFAIKKHWLWILLPFYFIYAMAMMEKGLVVSILVPLIVYALLKRKIFSSAFFALIMIAGVYGLLLITNPMLRASREEIMLEMLQNHKIYDVPEKTMTASESFNESTRCLTERVVYSNGADVSRWFELIPDSIPFAKGCGYRFLAPLLGCEYKDYNYDRKVHSMLYKEKIKKSGVGGTTTVACFMYDYANFGWIGLILSSFCLAIVFATIQRIFKGEPQLKISLNLLPVLWLSSAPLTSTLLSGGWMLTILLFLVFKNSLKKEEESLN
jgi:hypothetical protein